MTHFFIYNQTELDNDRRSVNLLWFNYCY